MSQLPGAKGLDGPTLEDHIPQLLDELAQEWRSSSDQTIAESVLEGSPPAHGRQRFHDGFDIVEVVSEYNILRAGIYDLAARHDVSLEGGAFHIMNRVFDEAIGVAVQTFATQQALEIQRRRDEYLAFVAHDLRTPLNAISLATQTLTRKLTNDTMKPELARMLKTLRRNEQRLGTLVDSVLKETGQVRADATVKVEPREFDLWPLVESIISELAPVAETCGAHVINDVPDELDAYADAELVRRVVQNLVVNAINFTPRGQVTVGARRTDGPGSLECWVEDNGAGIPQSRLTTIFEKGETDHPEADSAGLGLPIVKTFVEAHGGSVTVSSKEGRGSRFLFTLPGRPPPSAASETRPPAPASDDSH